MSITCGGKVLYTRDGVRVVFMVPPLPWMACKPHPRACIGHPRAIRGRDGCAWCVHALLLTDTSLCVLQPHAVYYRYYPPLFIRLCLYAFVYSPDSLLRFRCALLRTLRSMCESACYLRPRGAPAAA